MTASDIAIRAVDLKKIYRLYSKPSYRFRDMFGLLGNRPGAYSEHAALDGINLEIRRGEKVAIIGRNGAGKSTLLKLVTGVIAPTAGSLQVNGDIHALLQIGTGFHPDFTGRENVHAYFAQLGVTGAEADRRCADVVEFAELEEYIDQPVKTYSTGMAVRLMFSASTAITPDLLVLDEVLGVGDAYFSHKSFERIRELCERNGTTLLLVTHDIYSAVKLCGRVVWIERGQVLVDGDGPTVVKAYEDSIRQQEERRLRLRKQRQVERLARDVGSGARVIAEIGSADGRALQTPVFFSAVTLVLDDIVISAWPLGDDAFRDQSQSHLQREGAVWGEPTMHEGRAARSMMNFGSAFAKVAGVFATDRVLQAADLPRLGCSIDYWMTDATDLNVRLFVNGHEVGMGALPRTVGRWVTHIARPDHGAAVPTAINTSGIHGTGDVVVTGARFVSRAGEELFMLCHGEPAALEIGYEIRNRRLSERAQVVVALHRDGVQDVCRFIGRNLNFSGAAQPTGTVRLCIPSLTLTDGRYEVTIMIAEEGYYDRAQTVFYTINPGVYCCMSRMFEVTVEGSGLIGSGTMQLGTGEWTLR